MADAATIIISRIQYDTLHPGKLLRRTLAGYLSHAIEEFPVEPRSIYEMVVVGNRAGLQPGQLVRPKVTAMNSSQ